MEPVAAAARRRLVAFALSAVKPALPEMEPLAASARRRLVAFALSAVKPAPTGPTAMGILGRDPAVLATEKRAVASGLYAHPSSSFSAAEEACFSNGAALSSNKGTGGECLWAYGCAASSSDKDSCGAYFSYGAACSRVKGTDAGSFGSYGAATASSEDPSKATLPARVPALLFSSPTMSRHPSRVQTRVMGVRYFSAKPSHDGSNRQDPECKSACKLDCTLLMEKLDSIDQNVSKTVEQYKIINNKVDGTVEACKMLSGDVQKLQKEQKGSGDWTSVKIFGKNLNLLAVGRVIVDLWNKIPK